MLTVFGVSLFLSFFAGLRSSSGDEEQVFEKQRKDMVAQQIQDRGIKDPAVISAMLKVKRHLFVPEDAKPYAYTDSALPAEAGQTISQPYIVALMTELASIRPTDIVLEIGTGTGYQAAILAELAQKVYTIEIIPELAQHATLRLAKLGYKNIEVRCGDGYLGWPETAPFDAILVTAAAKEVPRELVKQLKPGGRLVIPLGDFLQNLFLITKNQDGTVNTKEIIPVRFVPLVVKKQAPSP